MTRPIHSRQPWLTALAVTLFALSAGCRQSPDEARKDAPKWFEWSTGQKLPGTVTVTNARCMTVLGVGDTYYIELTAAPELEALLKRHFKVESAAPEDLTLPADWLKEMLFWKPEQLPAPQWYSKVRPETGEPEWSCSAAYDAGAGKCFFVGAQCR